jgi:AcrR family transcriptional regulator
VIPVPDPVKSQRPYDTSGRRAAALARRDAVLDTARELFLRLGFAGTTVAAIAAGAGVSRETVYKTFGGKTGLVEALYRQGLRGAGPVTAYQRSEALRANPDAHEVARGWSRLAAEVSPRVSPILLLVRDAALVDPGLRDLLEELDDDRYRRMTDNARYLHEAGHLRRGVTLQAAADVLWTVTSPELFELLVVRRGWQPERFGDYVYSAIAGLLPPGDGRTPGP